MNIGKLPRYSGPAVPTLTNMEDYKGPQADINAKRQAYLDKYAEDHRVIDAEKKKKTDTALTGMLAQVGNIVDDTRMEKKEALQEGRRRGRAATILRPLGGLGSGTDSFGLNDMPSARRTLLGA